MKRTIRLIITLALVAALMAACAPGGAPKQTEPPVPPETTTAPAETTTPPTTPPDPTESVPASTEQIVPPETKPADRITRDKAITIALQHAGVTRDQARQLEAELDKDNGIVHYDVDFETKDYEYDYEIHAETGKLLKAEKEKND